ncbi:Uncharacterized protein QTN25_010096 [Entamoeba marina]
MEHHNSSTTNPLKVLGDLPGDIAQNVIFVWNFLKQYEDVHTLNNISFKNLVVSIFYPRLVSGQSMVVLLFKFLLTNMFDEDEYLGLRKADLEIDVFTIPTLVSIVMERDNLQQSKFIVRSMKNYNTLIGTQPKVILYSLTRLIQKYLQTNAENIPKNQGRLLGVDKQSCNYYLMNGFLLIELPMYPSWYLVNSKERFNALVNYLSDSSVKRDQDLAAHIKALKRRIHTGAKVAQEFGIVNNELNGDILPTKSYAVFSTPYTIEMYNMFIKEQLGKLKTASVTIVEQIINTMRKYSIKPKDSEFINRRLDIIKNLAESEHYNYPVTQIHSCLIKILSKIPIPIQNQKMWKKLFPYFSTETLNASTFSTLVVTYQCLNLMLNFKHVKYNLDISSYEDIDSSDLESISEEYSLADIADISSSDELNPMDEDVSEPTTDTESNNTSTPTTSSTSSGSESSSESSPSTSQQILEYEITSDSSSPETAPHFMSISDDTTSSTEES